MLKCVISTVISLGTNLYCLQVQARSKGVKQVAVIDDGEEGPFRRADKRG